MADITTLLSKFLNGLYAGNLYTGNPTGGAAVGMPVIQAVGRATAQVAANANVVTYTVGAADGTFEASFDVLVTVATNHSFNVGLVYTDEGNTARNTAMGCQDTSTGNYATAIVNTSGAIPWRGFVQQFRAKAGTTITLITQGTFTTVTYNVEGTIKQTA
jgi:hypothetical protein